MSYANYQYAGALLLHLLIGLTSDLVLVFAGAKRRLSKSSRIHALWMNAKRGVRKFFTAAGRIRVCRNHFLRRRTSAARSVRRKTAGPFLFLARRTGAVAALRMEEVWGWHRWAASPAMVRTGARISIHRTWRDRTISEILTGDHGRSRPHLLDV